MAHSRMRRSRSKRAITMQALARGGRPRVQDLLWGLQRGHCFYCGKVLDLPEVSADHLTPVCRGGESTLANLRAACRECNNTKADLTLEEYRVVCGGARFYGEPCHDA